MLEDTVSELENTMQQIQDTILVGPAVGRGG